MQILDFEEIFLLKSCLTKFWFCVYLLEPIPECTPDLCQNGGKCLRKLGAFSGYYCQCAPGFQGSHCQGLCIYFFQYLAKHTKHGIEEAP